MIITKVSRSQCLDSGMALTLIALLAAAFSSYTFPSIYVAIAALLVTMTWPTLLKPFAIFWFSLSHIMGSVVSKIILSIIFFLLITPLGIIVGFLKKDPLQIKQFKSSTASVFKTRNHVFAAADLDNPY